MARKATMRDLMLELWSRQRNSGSIYWVTKEGKIIPIKDMDDRHLMNTLEMLIRKADEEEHAFEIAPMDYYD